MDEDIVRTTFNIERKLMVVGAAGAGKSAFTLQVSRHRFAPEDHPFIQEMNKARASMDEMVMVLDILDPRGFPENETKLIADHAEFVDKVHMLIVVYDITNRPSFERVPEYWHKATKLIGKTDNIKPVSVLIGTKLDLQEQRAVKTEEGEQLARELGMMFGEVSSKTRENIEEVMDKALMEIAVLNPRARELKPTIKVTPYHLSDRMSSLLKSPIFSDAVLTLNEHKWNVHKFILSARSPVLFEMFKDPSVNEVSIKGDNISPDAVTALIHFMYTGLVDFSPKIASQVEVLSVEYKLEKLGEIAADIAKNGSYEPTSESLATRAWDLSRDMLNLLRKGIEHGAHPAFDVALKVNDERAVLTSRALLAHNSKYFMDLFEKNQGYEVQVDVPNLTQAIMSRIVNWVCGNEMHQSTPLYDIETMQIVAKFNLHKSFIETMEYNTGKYLMSYGISIKERVGILNQNVAEQLKALAEWQTALKYDEISKETGVWKQINSKSRKNIQNLATEMGTLVNDDNKRGCLIS